jgi:TonB family protein
MHPLLRTLDLKAGAGTESSVYDLHPIRDRASERSRGIPLLLSLGLTPLLIYGLSLSLIAPETMEAVNGALDQARRSVSLLLWEPGRPLEKSVAGPSVTSGKGHIDGNGSLDPRLAAYATRTSHPTDTIDPDELTAAPTEGGVDLSLNATLPLQAGGNGLAVGTGRESGLKGAGGIGGGAGPYDFRLIPTRQVEAIHQMVRGENPALLEPVRVLIQVDNDGVTFQATVVSGPAFLHEESLKAARQWRFEPLAAHGLKGPIYLTLTFYPKVKKPK